jgi:AhpD family alkylhydroperoxidase
MTPRLDGTKYYDSTLARTLRSMNSEIEASALELSVLELVKIRASQINGCASCLDIHTKEARTIAETEERIYALNARREIPYLAPRERAALECCEALTLVAKTHAPSDVYESVRQHFDEAEFFALTVAVREINSWNRFGIAYRPVVGMYQSPRAAAHARCDVPPNVSCLRGTPVREPGAPAR